MNIPVLLAVIKIIPVAAEPRVQEPFLRRENLHPAELFVRNGENSDFSFLRQSVFYTSCVDIRVLLALAEPHVDGELKHHEAASSKTLRNFAATRRSFFVSVGRSNSTITHIFLYALNREACIIQDKGPFAATLRNTYTSWL